MTTDTMSPLFEKGQAVQIDKKAYKLELPERYDVVAYEESSNGYVNVMRIVGLPKEKIRFEDDAFYIDGKEMTLPDTVSYFVFGDGMESFGVNEDFFIPEDQYFLIGENMKKTFDSRFNGSIPFRRIVGKVRTMETE